MRFVCILMLVLSIGGAACAANLNPSSPFGIVCPWPGVEGTGIGWVRCGAGATALANWPSIEKQKGVFTWESSDGELKRVIEQGLTPLPIIGYSPEWASSDAKKHQSGCPTDVLDYGSFARVIVDRYKASVPCWEMWNEQDIGFFKGSISQYADLLKAGYTGAKVADPKCRVLFGGTAGVDIPFTKSVYECGAKDYFDVFAVHPYQWAPVFNEEAFISQLSDLRRLMNSEGDTHKEIWLTELGWATNDKNIPEDVQARLLTEVMVTTLSLKEMGVTKAFWFCVRDWGGPGYGIIRPDDTHKPAFTSFATVTKVLDGAEFAGRLDLGDGVTCRLFTRGNPKRVIAVIWSEKATPVKLAASSAQGLDYMGENVALDPDANGTCTIMAKPQPLFVIGADASVLAKATKPSLPAFKPKPMSTKPPVTAWASLVAPVNTTKAYVIAGQKSTLSVRLFNMGQKAISGKLSMAIEGLPKPEPVQYSVAAGKSTVLDFVVDAPTDASLGSAKCVVKGDSIAPLNAVIHVNDKRLIEFFANSFVEGKYMEKDEHSGGAPSVRFNGAWTYKFDLSDSRAPEVKLCIGGGRCEVLASSDQQNWKTIATGKGPRAWRSARLDDYAGKTLYLKITGEDQQMEELALSY